MPNFYLAELVVNQGVVCIPCRILLLAAKLMTVPEVNTVAGKKAATSPFYGGLATDS